MQWWTMRSVLGAQGFVPLNYIDKVEPSNAKTANAVTTTGNLSNSKPHPQDAGGGAVRKQNGSSVMTGNHSNSKPHPQDGGGVVSKQSGSIVFYISMLKIVQSGVVTCTCMYTCKYTCTCTWYTCIILYM